MRGEADLVVPWHPHQLALWLLSRASEVPAATLAPLRRPRTTAQAQAWLRLARPDDAAALAALSDPDRAEATARGLWLHGEAGQQLLRRALAADAPTAQRAVLALDHKELLDAAPQVAAAVQVFLHGDDEDQRQSVAWLLRRAPGDVPSELARHLATPGDDRRRALGLWCQLEGGAGAARAVLACLDDDDQVVRERAMAVLASAAPPPDACRDAVSGLLQLVTNRRQGSIRVLAVDALANLGAAVDAEARDQLASLLEAAPPWLAARLLGCLRRLDAVPATLTAAAKARIAGNGFATDDSWLAIADDGEAGAAVLGGILQQRAHPASADQAAPACARRLLQTAPAALRGWLEGGPMLQGLAIGALAPLGKDSGVEPARILAAAQHVAREPAAKAWRWLFLQPGGEQHAEAALRRIAAFRSSWLLPDEIAAMREAPLPLAQKLTLLEPLLQEGRGFEAVRGGDAEELRAACHRWLAKATEPAVRSRLLGELARLGLRGDEELDWARACLRSRDADELLQGLEAAPALPAGLRPELERRIDEVLAADGNLPRWDRSYGVLLAHARR